MDIREQLARDLLGASYGDLTGPKRSVIDLIADQKPSGLGPSLHLDERDGWQKLADRVARVGGSWSFIIAFVIALAAWVTLNALLATRAFDPYPFIFLNLMLSMVAALQAPIIMMSQNRQAAKDRLAAALDYEVNVKSETAIAELHDKVDRLQDALDRLLASGAEQELRRPANDLARRAA